MHLASLIGIGEVAKILGRKDSEAVRRDHLRPMIKAGELIHTYPDMERHPHQAYRAVLPSEPDEA